MALADALNTYRSGVDENGHIGLLVSLYVAAATEQGVIDVERTAFEAFKDLDSDLKDSSRPLPANVQTIIEGCIG